MLSVSLPPSWPLIQFHRGDLTAAQGFWADGLSAHLRDSSLDMALVVSRVPATFAGVFTTNAVRAAPVDLTEKVHQSGTSRAIVINSKNANALTGVRGRRDAEAMQNQVAEGLGAASSEVAVASTGVIGLPLPMDKIEAGISQLSERWRDGRAANGGAAAQAILTTDTTTKSAAVTIDLSTGRVEIGMMVKGSGMIHPQMATMLAFFATDAGIERSVLDRLLRAAVERSFHRISVDGDQSTNDMVLILANGCSGVSIERAEDLEQFERGLTALARYGARLIAADGEGATHLITVRVEGALTEADAALKARAVARSALVKTAVYGRDPNWGRVLAAAGTAGRPFDPDTVSLSMNGLPLYVAGEPIIGQDAAWSGSMDRPEIEFCLDLAQGSESAEAFGCDLTDGYVAINAHYRT